MKLEDAKRMIADHKTRIEQQEQRFRVAYWDMANPDALQYVPDPKSDRFEDCFRTLTEATSFMREFADAGVVFQVEKCYIVDAHSLKAVTTIDP